MEGGRREVPVDLQELDNEIVLRVDMPGVLKEDLQVRYDPKKGSVEINYERKPPEGVNTEN